MQYPISRADLIVVSNVLPRARAGRETRWRGFSGCDGIPQAKLSGSYTNG